MIPHLSTLKICGNYTILFKINTWICKSFLARAIFGWCVKSVDLNISPELESIDKQTDYRIVH